MRALFILQSGQFLYGASRSIEGLLKNIDYDYDIMICKSFTNQIDQEAIRKRLGKNLKNIYIVWLPRFRCHFFDKNGLISELSHYVNNIMAFLSSNSRKRIIRNGKYSYVHLNSLVLYPVIDEKSNFIIHAREIINPDYKLVNYLRSKLKRAAGIIYIDDATKVSVEENYVHPYTVLINNPFDMTKVKDVDYNETMKQYGFDETNTVFSMLGQIGKSKGSDIVINAFHSVNDPLIRLLVAGNYNNPFAKQMMEKYKDDKRIIFCGELEDTTPIYRISDYIFRGEDQFCIGRTVFEGLYAGCAIVMPGKASDIMRVPEGERWNDRIFFYEPHNMNDLAKVIMTVANKKICNRTYNSNIDYYVKEYSSYIKGLLHLGERMD